VRILVVEDEPLVAAAITVALKRQGWAVDAARDVVEARWLVGEVPFDALVVDVNLPGGNGIDFCRELREEGDSTPLLILTSLSDVSSRVLGLDSGADDYLPKPFNSAELCARLRAMWRRPRVALKPIITVGDLVVDPGSRSVTRAGTRIPMAAREFAFVHLLARNCGATVTRHEIFDALWDFAAEPDANTLDVLVRSVRVKLDRPFDTPLLLTVRGVGYMLDAPDARADAGEHLEPDPDDGNTDDRDTDDGATDEAATDDDGEDRQNRSARAG